MCKEIQALHMHEMSDRQRSEMSCRAVSLEFIKIFNEYVRREVTEREFAELKTEDLVHGTDKTFEQDPAGWSIRGVTSVTKNTLADFITSDVAASETFVKKLCSIRTEMIEQGEIDSDMRDATCENLAKSWFGPADFFVSHAWKKEWGNLYEAVCSPRSVNETEKEYKNRRGYFYWLDIFAVNQHSGDKTGEYIEIVKSEVSEDLEGFGKVVENVKKGLVLVFEPWNDPEVLRRAWCWQEIAAAISNQREVLLGFGKESAKRIDEILDSYNHRIGLESRKRDEYKKQAKKLLDVMESLHANNSTCSKTEDQERIHSKLRAIGGTSFAGANRRMKYAIALLLLNAAKLRDKSQGMFETGSAVGLLKELSSHFELGTKEHAVLLNELSKQCSKLGENKVALQYGMEAEKGLTIHIDTLPVLSGKGIDEYRFDNLLLLAEIQLRISRGYCEQYEKGLVEECVQYCNKALDTVRIVNVLFESDQKNGKKGGNVANERAQSTLVDRIQSIKYNANYHVIRTIALYHEGIKENYRDREKDIEEVGRRFKAIEEMMNERIDSVQSIEYNANNQMTQTTALCHEGIKKNNNREREKDIEEVRQRFKAIGEIMKEKIGEYGATYVLKAKFLDAILRKENYQLESKFINQMIEAGKLNPSDCTQKGIENLFLQGIAIQQCGYGKDNPKELMSHQSFGYFWFNRKEYGKALEKYRKALGLNDKYERDPAVRGLLGFVKTSECPANRPLYSFKMVLDAFDGVEKDTKADLASTITVQRGICNLFRVLLEYLEDTLKDPQLRAVFASNSSRKKLDILESYCKRRVEDFRELCNSQEQTTSQPLQATKKAFEEVSHSIIETIASCKRVRKSKEFLSFSSGLSATSKSRPLSSLCSPPKKHVRRFRTPSSKPSSVASE